MNSNYTAIPTDIALGKSGFYVNDDSESTNNSQTNES